MQAGDGEGRFGPTDQRQRTLQKPGLYLVIVAVTLSSVGNLNKLTAPLPCTLWHPGKMQERRGGDMTG